MQASGLSLSIRCGVENLATYCTEVLDAHLFANLLQVQAITHRWLIDCNEYRPGAVDDKKVPFRTVPSSGSKITYFHG